MVGESGSRGLLVPRGCCRLQPTDGEPVTRVRTHVVAKKHAEGRAGGPCRAGPRVWFLSGLGCAEGGRYTYLVMMLSVQAEVRPMTWAMPAFAPGCWRPPDSPLSCQTISDMPQAPVAPSGWPLEMRPPLAFTATFPPMSNLPSF